MSTGSFRRPNKKGMWIIPPSHPLSKVEFELSQSVKDTTDDDAGICCRFQRVPKPLSASKSFLDHRRSTRAEDFPVPLTLDRSC